MKNIVSFVSFLVVIFAVTNDLYFKGNKKGVMCNEEYKHPLFI
jgi:hypothetical protein